MLCTGRDGCTGLHRTGLGWPGLGWAGAGRELPWAGLTHNLYSSQPSPWGELLVNVILLHLQKGT